MKSIWGGESFRGLVFIEFWLLPGVGEETILTDWERDSRSEKLSCDSWSAISDTDASRLMAASLTAVQWMIAKLSAKHKWKPPRGGLQLCRLLPRSVTSTTNTRKSGSTGFPTLSQWVNLSLEVDSQYVLHNVRLEYLLNSIYWAYTECRGGVPNVYNTWWDRRRLST